MKKVVWLLFCLLFLIVLNLEFVLAENASVNLTLVDTNGTYIYSSSCSQTPRERWQNIHLYVYNESGDTIISSGSKGCEINFDLPNGTYRIKVIGRTYHDGWSGQTQAYLPLYEKTN